MANSIGAQSDLRVEKSVNKVLGMCVEHDKAAETLQISKYRLIDSTVNRFGL